MRVIKASKIFTILLSKLKDEKIMLGRWKIDYNEQRLQRIVQLANEDNCGVCETVVIQPRQSQTQSQNNKYDFIYILDDINIIGNKLTK